jgi:hypothetical protein
VKKLRILTIPDTLVKFYVPWDDYKVISPDSVDFMYSQAVPEHVEDLEGTYLPSQNG